MAGSPTLFPESRFGSTLRRDAWWIEILPVVVVLGGCSQGHWGAGNGDSTRRLLELSLGGLDELDSAVHGVRTERAS